MWSCGRALSLGLGATVCACSLAIDTAGLASGRNSQDSRADVGDAGNVPDVGDASIDAPVVDAPNPGATSFTDSFARSDGPIANGWIEKTPGSFVIAGEQVVLQSGGAYANLLVRRPASEDALNVEVAVECVLSSFDQAYPQLYARVQSSTAATPNSLEGYAFYFDAANGKAYVAKQHGTSGPLVLATVTPSPPLNPSERFRLTMRVTGDSPVKIDASFDRLDGATATRLGQTSVSDSASDRITTAGSVGFSASGTVQVVYDNFRRDTL